MSHLENAGYRLLSFKYTPSKPTRDDVQQAEQQAGQDDDTAGSSAAAAKAEAEAEGETEAEAEGETEAEAETELPSLAPLMAALSEVEDTERTRQQGNKAESNPDKDDNNSKKPPASSPASVSPPPTHTTPQYAEFHCFCDLPAEIRIKIWHLTFLPRAVELHPTRPNYSAVHDDPGRQPMWQSGCSNPAALSVCAESRELALEHFRIPFPLAAITADQAEPTPFSRYAGDTSTYNFSGISVNGKARILHRVLHVSPAQDTVALLGQDSDFMKLSQLMKAFREADPLGMGIDRLALSVRGWGYGGSATMMKSLGRTILKDLEQLTLFMYGERSPPPEWRAKGATLDEESLEQFRKTGNRCDLITCEGGNAWYAYRVWSGGKGRQFWDTDGRILRVGKNEMQIMDLIFEDGW
ncbi:hypothetical protein VP1G_02133 [Cytospora mali]|uniref:2EXR domain-containing protein n=1 Tax=Cytospora mali TaxID=578113 RepID=A0A194USV7_CYTMA|nr:hypothetical protein VP1G_02133 [Valsa mali var. pyri (nom. inval.)]